MSHLQGGAFSSAQQHPTEAAAVDSSSRSKKSHKGGRAQVAAVAVEEDVFTVLPVQADAGVMASLCQVGHLLGLCLEVGRL
jgi:hypothetical protein